MPEAANRGRARPGCDRPGRSPAPACRRRRRSRRRGRSRRSWWGHTPRRPRRAAQAPRRGEPAPALADAIAALDRGDQLLDVVALPAGAASPVVPGVGIGRCGAGLGHDDDGAEGTDRLHEFAVGGVQPVVVGTPRPVQQVKHGQPTPAVVVLGNQDVDPECRRAARLPGRRVGHRHVLRVDAAARHGQRLERRGRRRRAERQHQCRRATGQNPGRHQLVAKWR